MRSFTSADVRHDLDVRAGGTRVLHQAHHELPVRSAERFEQMGLKTFDPGHAVWWCGASHASNAAAYDRDWHTSSDDNPKAGKPAVSAHVDRLDRAWSGRYDCPPGTKAPV